MELTVEERLRLIEILPPQGNFATLKTVRELRERLAFDEDGEELCLKFGPHVWEDPRDIRESDEEYNSRMALPHQPDLVSWRSIAARDIPLSGKQTSIIVETLKRLNDQGQLRMNLMGLYEKFVEPPDSS